MAAKRGRDEAGQNDGDALMEALDITPHVLINWFAWGFFMGLGWTLASWLVNRVLARL